MRFSTAGVAIVATILGFSASGPAVATPAEGDIRRTPIRGRSTQ